MKTKTVYELFNAGDSIEGIEKAVNKFLSIRTDVEIISISNMSVDHPYGDHTYYVGITYKEEVKE